MSIKKIEAKINNFVIFFSKTSVSSASAILSAYKKVKEGNPKIRWKENLRENPKTLTISIIILVHRGELLAIVIAKDPISQGAGGGEILDSQSKPGWRKCTYET